MRGQQPIVERGETGIEITPKQEMCELSDEDIEFLNENETLKEIAPLFLLEKGDRKLTYLFGKLIYANFILKYLHEYSKMLKNEFGFSETTPKEICNKDFLERMQNEFDENKNKYILTTRDHVLPQLSEYLDSLQTKSFEDLVLLSNICETQSEMIKDIKKEDILWLYETAHQFKRETDSLNLHRDKPLHEHPPPNIYVTNIQVNIRGKNPDLEDRVWKK